MKQDELAHTLAVARNEKPADLLLKNGRTVNVFTGEILEVDVAIAGETIAGLGLDYRGREEIDLDGSYLIPGLIDCHVHVESSLVGPLQFARAVVPHGVTTVVADPHEIANVSGADGIAYMLAASEGLPLTVFITLPSCVPATHLGTSGAELAAGDLLGLKDHPRVLGLAEFMNVPGAVLGLPGAIDKLLAFRNTHIDGHAPGCTGAWLQAYAASGPSTDHETMTSEEALEKVRTGMYVMIREASAARNLRDILPSITPENSRRFCFATDDRHPVDLIGEGSIDNHIRIAVKEGLDPVTAIRLATINGAEAFGLGDRGAIAPGRRADLVVTPSLERFRASQVLSGGKFVARDGHPTGDWPQPVVNIPSVRDTIHIETDTVSLRIPASGKQAGARIRVIEIIPDQLVTDERIMTAAISNGEATADPPRDLLKLAVVERHQRSGRVGLGFLRGLGLQRGAIAGSVGHDCHNIIVAGTNDPDMISAIRAIRASGGGYVAVLDGKILARVPLPVAGLISDQSIEIVSSQMDDLLRGVARLGSSFHDPFKYLSFMALEVIPRLKLTDRGLVDVEKFDFVPLWID